MGLHPRADWNAAVGGVQTCLPWKIRTFLMFPNPEEGNMAPQFHSADSPWDHCHGPGSR